MGPIGSRSVSVLCQAPIRHGLQRVAQLQPGPDKRKDEVKTADERRRGYRRGQRSSSVVSGRAILRENQLAEVRSRYEGNAE